MAEGTIKTIMHRGFGFIRTDGSDPFFHMTAPAGVTFEALQTGQRISYTDNGRDRGPRAQNVRPL